MKGETNNAVKAGSEIIHSRYYVHFIYIIRIPIKVLRETTLVKPTGPAVINKKHIQEEIKSKQHARRVSARSVKTPASSLLSNVKITHST